MTDKKIIAVVGSTGAQGGGLARAILADPDGEFAVRAITRDPSKEQAQALGAAGAEVVQADLDDEATLREAFAGAYGVYGVTNFWEHFSPEREIAQARNIAGAAKEAGIEHLIWSTLEEVRKYVPLDDDRMPTLQGSYKAPHFDGKAQADAFFADAGIPTTYLLPSWYFENMIFFGQGPTRGEDGTLVFTLPLADGKLAAIAAEDVGKCAFGMFRRGRDLVGERIGVGGAQLTGDEMAAAFSKAFGEEVAYRPLTWDEYRALGFPGANEMGNTYQFYVEFGDVVNSARDVERSRSLNPELQSFDEWLAVNKDRIPNI